MHTKRTKKYNKYKEKLIFEILDIYEVIYKYNDQDLIEVMNILRHTPIEKLKYIYTKLNQSKYYKINTKSYIIL